MQQIKITDFESSLYETGCSTQETAEFIKLLQSGKHQNAALLLRRHKQLLLAELHRTEHKIDLLDFLLYQLKNAEYANNARKDGTI